MKAELNLPFEFDNIKRIVMPAPEKISIKATDGITLTADLYSIDNIKPIGGILLLHGSAPWGRKAGLIRLIATRFKDLGYIVLAPDARGFGQSENPVMIDRVDSWNVKNDLHKWLNFLSLFLKKDNRKIYVVGHSLGAGQALEGCLVDDLISALVLIGPPRYLRGEIMSFWERVRFSSDRKLQRLISNELAIARVRKTNILNYISRMHISGIAKPVLLIDGEFEGTENLAFLNEISTKIGPSATYITLPRTGHYCGVWNLFGSGTVYYRPEIFNSFLEVVQDFIATQAINQK